MTPSLAPRWRLPASPLGRARLSAAVLFFVNGVVLASWASRVPAVQQRLGLSAGHLGLSLLGMAVGALPAMSLAALLLARYDSRTVSRLAALLMCLMLPLPALAFSAPSLFGALMLLGACSGAINVAVNAQAAAIEAAYRSPIMASFHALFSLGGLAGALIGAGISAANVAPAVHLALIAGLLIVLVLVVSPGLLSTFAGTAAGLSKIPSGGVLRPLLALCAIAFSTVLCEGAVADWSAVYLRREIGAAASLAALGYAAFALTMVAGRATGDRLCHRWGDKSVVRASALLGAAGLGGALLLGGAAATLAGFACVGLGCACVYPTMVRASARLRDISPNAAIAAISTAGYMGFFVGPPLIGLVADHVTLRGALWLVVAASGAIALLSPAVDPATRLAAVAALPTAPADSRG